MADINEFKKWLSDNCMSRTFDFRADSQKIFGVGDFCNLNGWCDPATMALLNFAVTECLDDEEEYLEIGSYCGRSLIAALFNNNKTAQVIEPFDIFLPDGAFIQSLWDKNIGTFNLRNRITLNKADCNKFDEKLPKSIGVFFFDGNHNSGHTYEGLKKFTPFLSDNAIIIVDDYHSGGAGQSHPFPGYPLSDKPVKTDVDNWINDNSEHAELIWVAPWINAQAIISYERK